MSNQADFFVDSGTLLQQAPSYVTRPADNDLLQHVLSGEFCYVLTARQMGKSSLMIRTARSLQERGVKTAIVDLTIIGTVPIDKWYLGLLARIKGDLSLTTDVSGWWREHQDLGAPQRFFEFLHDVLLQEIAGPIVIFIDEIDTTLNLDFRDDFFATIRAMYNARATDAIFKRLTFVLLGVATPTDLIKDQKRTPFNIGSRIELRDFSYDEATPLKKGLDAAHPGQGDRILRRIFYWTNGHPYLTQKLCLAAAQTPTQDWDDVKADQLVQANFFDEDVRSDSNLTFVQDRIRTTPIPQRRRLLELYGAVRSGIAVANDDRSPVQNYLELFGLIRVERGRLQVRNRIYRHVFDDKWVQSLLPAPELLSEERSRLEPPPVLRVRRWPWRIIAFAILMVAIISAIAGLAFAGFRASQGNAQATETVGVVALATHTDEPLTAISPSILPTLVPPIDTPTSEPPTIPRTSAQPAATPTSTFTPTLILTPTPIPTCRAIVGVNIRSAPSNNAAIIDALPEGSNTTPLARDSDAFWLVVQGPQRRGWVTASAEVLSCNFNIQDLQSVANIPTPIPAP